MQCTRKNKPIVDSQLVGLMEEATHWRQLGLLSRLLDENQSPHQNPDIFFSPLTCLGLDHELPIRIYGLLQTLHGTTRPDC